jgi:hypothetical protein
MTEWGMVHATRNCWRLASSVAGRESELFKLELTGSWHELAWFGIGWNEVRLFAAFHIRLSPFQGRISTLHQSLMMYLDGVLQGCRCTWTCILQAS